MPVLYVDAACGFGTFRTGLMERLLRQASPLHLHAEEFDAATGRHLGNFPQAFSHLALIETAARIILAERLAEYTR